MGRTPPNEGDDWVELPGNDAADEHGLDRGRQRRPARALPWLLALLVGAGLAAVVLRDADERAQLKAEVAKARDESAELRRGLLLTQDRLEGSDRERKKESEAAAQLRQKAGADDQLIADLRKELDSKDGDVSSQAGEITVNVVDQILFKSGDAEISPRGKEVLTKLGGVLKQVSNKQILIGGHTDDRPIHTAQFPSNWELSAARAVNVVHFLVDTAKVPAERMTAAAYSEFHPRSKTEKAKNRRIEILLTPEIAGK